jgi:hypothetical protein
MLIQTRALDHVIMAVVTVIDAMITKNQEIVDLTAGAPENEYTDRFLDLKKMDYREYFTG